MTSRDLPSRARLQRYEGRADDGSDTVNAADIRKADPFDVLIMHEVRLDSHQTRLDLIDQRLQMAAYSSFGTLVTVIGTLLWRLITNHGAL